MDPVSYAVNVCAGQGLIARCGDVVMYLAESASPGPLLAAVREAAEAPEPGAVLMQRIAALAVGPAAAAVPAFGITAPVDGGLLVIVRGPVTAEVTDAGAAHILSGERAFSWLDEVFDHPVAAVSMAPAAAQPSVCAHTDLEAGVVPGGGFVLRPRGEVRNGSPAGTVIGVSAEPGGVTEIIRPDLTGARPAPKSAAARSETSTLAAVAAVLAGDDGSVYPLDRTYVIGRAPLDDDAVRGAGASPIVLRDDPYVSRVHAHISVDAGQVTVRDADTPAGTFIAEPGAKQWTRVGATGTPFPAGWSMRVGERILRHDG